VSVVGSGIVRDVMGFAWSMWCVVFVVISLFVVVESFMRFVYDAVGEFYVSDRV